MPSDAKRLMQVYLHLRNIKAGEYPQIVESDNDRDGGYKIVDRPWKDVPEPSKLAILQSAVNWSGITNRDQAHILLGEVDPGRITEAQRDTLVRMADTPERRAVKGRMVEMER